MKQLHWTPIKPQVLDGTVWAEIDDGGVTFDTAAFEAKFQQKKRAVKDKKAAAPKKVIVELIDPKRSYNVNIALARFKMTHEAIRDAVLALDEQTLNEEKVNALVAIAPTSDEVETVLAYDGDMALLGNCEKFFRCLATIPNVQPRMDLLLNKIRFRTQYEELDTAIVVCASVLNVIKTSTRLRGLYTLILALGNYLNAAGHKGGAWGFDISLLIKLKQTKSVDNKLTLMDFLVDLVIKEHPDVRGVIDELKDVAAAARYELSWLQGQVGGLVQATRKVTRALEKPGERDEAVDRFVPVFTVFQAMSIPKLEKLKDKIMKLEADVTTTARLLGSSPSKLPLEGIMALYKEFCEDWLNSETKLSQLAIAAAKAAKRQAQKDAKQKQVDQKKKARKVALSRKSPDSDEPAAVGKVDGAMQELNNDNVSDIRLKLRRRRKKRQGHMTIKARRNSGTATMRGAGLGVIGSPKTPKNTMSRLKNVVSAKSLIIKSLASQAEEEAEKKELQLEEQLAHVQEGDEDAAERAREEEVKRERAEADRRAEEESREREAKATPDKQPKESEKKKKAVGFAGGKAAEDFSDFSESGSDASEGELGQL